MTGMDRDSSAQWDDYGYHHDDIGEPTGVDPSAKGDDDDVGEAP